MLILTNWLKEFTEIPNNTEQLARRLTDIGLEVEKIINPALQVQNAVVARVLAVKEHPEREDLKICTISGGNKSTRVVTTAPAVAEERNYIWAPPGSELLGNKIKTRKYAGISSEGMLCSSRELGLTREAHTLLSIPDVIAPGTDAVEALDLEDKILELDLTPNRADCLSYLGIARDYAAAENQDYTDPRPTKLDLSRKTDVDINIKDPEGCWAYSGASVENVRIQRSEFEIQKRLLKMGLRPLNNIVDITNYVLFEVGHPLHPFDADLLDYPLVIRRAKNGEQITTLDGEQRKLNSRDLLIADSKKAQALAGIMGGADAQVSVSTRNLLLEAAYFDPTTIRRSATEHKLHTEASHRFERGTDPKQFNRCLLRCLELIKKHQPQATICEPLTVREKSRKITSISYKPADFNRLIGYDPGTAAIKDNFKRLGLTVDSKNDTWEITPPSWRTDLNRSEDLTEEIVRLHGYEQIPVTYPTLAINQTSTPQEDIYEKISQFMVARGFSENITFSFVSEKQQQFNSNSDPYRIANPLSNRQAVLRQSLLDGLLESYQKNLKTDQSNIRLFELGRIYPGDSSKEPRCLGLVAGGELYRENWDNKNRTIDFYDIKGLIVTLLNRLGHYQIKFENKQHSGFETGRCAAISLNETEVGHLGKIDPSLAADFSDEPLFAAQIILDKLPAVEKTQFENYSSQPTVLRDLDLVVKKTQDVGPLKDSIRETAQWLESIEIFDIYQGKPLAEDEKSVSFSLVFRNPERTLSDREVNEIQDKIIKSLADKHNARLREA